MAEDADQFSAKPEEDRAPNDPWVHYVEAAIAYIMGGNLSIRSKKGIIPLIPNKEQRSLLYHIRDCARIHKPCRVITAKARQVGISTIVAAFFYTLTSMHKGLLAQVAAHNMDGCRGIWKIYQFYKENDKRKPKTTADSRKEIIFRGMHSGLQVAVADSDLGRGDMINLFHGSEYGFWKEPEETLETILSCVPDNYRSIVILESTGEPGTDFEDRFRTAYEQRKAFLAGEKDDEGKLIEDPEWFPMFHSWTDHEEYSRNVDSETARSIMHSGDRDERALLGMGVPVSALNWRRKKLAQAFNNNVDKFKAQFPATVDEAFAASTKTFFSRDSLEFLEDGIRDPDSRYEVHLGEDKRSELLIDDEDGRLRVYRPPMVGHRYVIGGDAAGESHVGADKRYKSQSAIVVVDEFDGEVVAVWSGFVNGHEFGDIMVALGYWYNTALIAPERNQHGYAGILRMHLELRYPKIYIQEQSDKDERAETDRLGWDQTVKNRAVILDVFQRLAHELRLVIPDAEMIAQMRSFVRHPSGKFKAEIGKRDDLVIASAIAFMLASRGKAWGVKDRHVAARAERAIESSRFANKPRSNIRPEMFGKIYQSPSRKRYA